jgi:RNA polymerase primary sigma factor
MTPQERFDANKGLVYHVAARYKVPEEDREDMLQEGFEALWRACLGFDETNGAQFSTYAGRAIGLAYTHFTRHAWNSSGLSACHEILVRAHKEHEEHGDDMPARYKPLIQTALSTEYYVNREDDEGVTIADELSVEDEYSIYAEDARRVLMEEIDSALTDKQRQMLMLRYGLDGNEPMTLEEVAQVVGHSRQYVHQQLGKALALLRHPRHSRNLKSL